MAVVDQPDTTDWTKEDWERETAALEASLSEAVGRVAIRFERLTASIRDVLEELCSIGIHDVYARVYDVQPRLLALIGHLPYQSLVWALEALWDGARIGTPLEPSLVKELLRLDDERNTIIHSLWWADQGAMPYRSKLHRRWSKHESEDVSLDQLASLSARLTLVDARLWELHNVLEEAGFADSDRVYGVAPFPYSLNSLDELRSFVDRFPETRLDAGSGVAVWSDSDTREYSVSVELAHPFGRRGVTLRGEWIKSLSADGIQGGLHDVVVALRAALDEAI
ncbi:MAG: hypothetical protein O2919_03245 [Chloroflexi bacterium]|nr:hypothetical protein [Chloroflexota bacterium]